MIGIPGHIVLGINLNQTQSSYVYNKKEVQFIDIHRNVIIPTTEELIETFNLQNINVDYSVIFSTYPFEKIMFRVINNLIISFNYSEKNSRNSKPLSHSYIVQLLLFKYLQINNYFFSNSIENPLNREIKEVMNQYFHLLTLSGFTEIIKQWKEDSQMLDNDDINLLVAYVSYFYFLIFLI